jgi:hypothetical protein
MHLVLQNYPLPPVGPTNQGLYQIDFAAAQPVPLTGAGINAYFIQSTVLSLLDDQGVRQVDQILARDSSYYYIQRVWRGTLQLDQGPGHSTGTSLADMVGASFEATAAAFVAAPYNTLANTYAYSYTTPPVVVTAMSNYMVAYIAYAAAQFPPNGPIWQTASSNQTVFFNSVYNLANGNNAVPGGCTNPPSQ